MKRLFVSQNNYGPSFVELSSNQLHHLKSVLRFQPQDTLEIVIDQKRIVKVEILVFKEDGIGIKELEAVKIASRPYTITLCQCLPKQDKFSDILDTCTQVGVDHFIPINSEHTVVSYKPDQFKKKEVRWLKKIESASEQSSRAAFPTLSQPAALSALCESSFVSEYDACLLAYEGESTAFLHDLLAESPSSIALLIGPEGGFSLSEVQRLQAAGWLSFSLGPTILRSEIAGLVATTSIQTLLAIPR